MKTIDTHSITLTVDLTTFPILLAVIVLSCVALASYVRV